MGGIKSVADTVGVSPGMLSKFLSVKELSPNVKELIKKRDINSVEFVNALRRFNEEEQKIIITEYLEGEINTPDVRTIPVLRYKNPEKDIIELINQVKSTKPIKTYLVYIDKVKIKVPMEKILNRIKDVVGEKGVVSVNIEGNVVIVKMSSEAKGLLGITAKKRRGSIRELLEEIIYG